MSDASLDDLIALNGVTFVVDPVGKHWVKFVVVRVEPSPGRPHGLNYSLTLHSGNGKRLVGFDNAHALNEAQKSGRKNSNMKDHRHRLHSIRPYHYKDAATLLSDFWAEVDSVLRERGVIP